MLLESKQFLKGSGELLSPTKKAELDTKMSNLEARWGRLQAELDNRYMRLVRIHEKLTKFEELLHPFLVCLPSGFNHFWDIKRCYSNFDSELLLPGFFRREKFLKATFNFQFLRIVRLLGVFFLCVFGFLQHKNDGHFQVTAGQNVSLIMWLRRVVTADVVIILSHKLPQSQNTQILPAKSLTLNLMWMTYSCMRPRVPLWVTVFFIFHHF